VPTAVHSSIGLANDRAPAALSTVLDRVGPYPKTFILDFEAVPLIDSTAANALRGFVHKLERSNVTVYFAAV
jgi:SulP family sulfate permease